MALQLYCQVQHMSSMSTNAYSSQSQHLIQNQALIPQNYKKSLEARALLEHYQEAQMRRIVDQRMAMDEKLREMEMAKIQSERHEIQREKRKLMKEQQKNQYSREYQQMIELRRQREKYEKEKQIWLEQRVLQDQNWLPDISQQKEVEKMKKLQYGKELERHLKLQEEKRINQANRIKEIRQKMKRQAEEAAKAQQQLKNRRKSMIEYKHNSLQGVKNALNWSTQEILSNESPKSQPLTPRMDHLLKLQHRRYYDKGMQPEYKSPNQKIYFQKQNPEQNRQQEKSYNPITNPIPYKYKNPNILKLLSDYS